MGSIDNPWLWAGWAAVVVLIFQRVFRRLGYPWWLAFSQIIPLAGLVVLAYCAFTEKIIRREDSERFHLGSLGDMKGRTMRQRTYLMLLSWLLLAGPAFASDSTGILSADIAALTVASPAAAAAETGAILGYCALGTIFPGLYMPTTYPVLDLQAVYAGTTCTAEWPAYCSSGYCRCPAGYIAVQLGVPATGGGLFGMAGTVVGACQRI